MQNKASKTCFLKIENTKDRPLCEKITTKEEEDEKEKRRGRRDKKNKRKRNENKGKGSQKLVSPSEKEVRYATVRIMYLIYMSKLQF